MDETKDFETKGRWSTLTVAANLAEAEKIRLEKGGLRDAAVRRGGACRRALGRDFLDPASAGRLCCLCRGGDLRVTCVRARALYAVAIFRPARA